MLKSVQTITKPSLDYKPYRLRCRFKIESYPLRQRLAREKVNVAEQFVDDMHKQGWEFIDSFGMSMKGPFPMVQAITIRSQPVLSARTMLHSVNQGLRFLDRGRDAVRNVPSLDTEEWWEYELLGVFQRPAVLMECPDSHEEEIN